MVQYRIILCNIPVHTDKVRADNRRGRGERRKEGEGEREWEEGRERKGGGGVGPGNTRRGPLLSIPLFHVKREPKRGF